MDLKFLKDYSEWYVKVGSRVTCDPPPTGTDQDVLVYTTNYYALITMLKNEQWAHEDYGTLTEFESYRKGEWNLLVSDQLDFAEKFLKATAECKKKNVMSKTERIAIFEGYFAKPKVKPWPSLFITQNEYQQMTAQNAQAMNAQGQAQANGGNPYQVGNEFSGLFGNAPPATESQW